MTSPGPRYALMPTELLAALEESAPNLLPIGSAAGAWLDKHHPVIASDRRLVVLTVYDLWDYWQNWETVLFEVEVALGGSEGGQTETSIRLVQRVERWNVHDLQLFACGQVEQVLYYFQKVKPRDMRPAHALQAARGYIKGTVTAQTLDSTRVGALAAWSTINAIQENVYAASPEQLDCLRAKDAARATVWIATRETRGEAPGTYARRAADAAFQARCRNPAGWIAAKVLGRYREADLLDYLGMGSSEERTAIREGEWLDGGSQPVRYALKMDTYEVVDLLAFDE